MEKENSFGKGSLVAVYGSLREGLGNHSVLRGSKRIGDCEVSGFEMISRTFFPAVYDAEDDKKIICEVWKVDEDSTARGLDGLEGYPRFYNRKLIQTEHGEAWIYFFDNKDMAAGSPVVKSGDWKKYLQEKRSSKMKEAID